MSMAAALHIQVAQATVDRLRLDAALVALLGTEAQIRQKLDTSGAPAGLSACIVRCRDLGKHLGQALLRDVELRVTVRTHMDEDPDREHHDAVTAAVLEICGAEWLPVLEGWVVRHQRSAESTDAEADSAGVFRDTDVVQEMLLQAVDEAPALVLDGGAPDTAFETASVSGGVP